MISQNKKVMKYIMIKQRLMVFGTVIVCVLINIIIIIIVLQIIPCCSLY